MPQQETACSVLIDRVTHMEWLNCKDITGYGRWALRNDVCPTLSGSFASPDSCNSALSQRSAFGSEDRLQTASALESRTEAEPHRSTATFRFVPQCAATACR